MDYDDEDRVEGTPLESAESEALAKSDPLAWLKAYLAVHGFDQTELDEIEYIKEPMGGVRLYLVDEEGGYEGGGEHCSRTFAIAPDGKVEHNGEVEGAFAYVETTGYYASYDGTTYEDDFYVVEPKEVMVVKYEKK